MRVRVQYRKFGFATKLTHRDFTDNPDKNLITRELLRVGKSEHGPAPGDWCVQLADDHYEIYDQRQFNNIFEVC